MLLIEYCIRGIYGWEIDESLSAEGTNHSRFPLLHRSAVRESRAGTGGNEGLSD